MHKINKKYLVLIAAICSMSSLIIACYCSYPVATHLIGLSSRNYLTWLVFMILWLPSLMALATIILAFKTFVLYRQARQETNYLQRCEIEHQLATFALNCITYSFACLFLTLIIIFAKANDYAIITAFFDTSLIALSFPLVVTAFWVNVKIIFLAEILILLWGLVIAIARLLPGPAARPIRAIATLYTDIFRALPAIITIYIIGFGLPMAELPFVRDWQPQSFAILALTLTYSAYTSEVYRAGLESVHPSQFASARSLGLSYMQALRYVILPQGVRKVIPPLVNDFISLQKDTALVNVIGTVDAFNQSKIIAGNHFNLSPVIVVALIFIVITLPQTRFADYLLERDKRQMQSKN